MKVFNLCYETCKTCKKAGNPEFHNCLTCDIDHMFRPDNSPNGNCVTECKYYYYFNHIGQYKCTTFDHCPEEAKLLIKEKNKCIDDCKKDSNYKYQYDGKCLIKCPEDTLNENYLCKKTNIYNCSLSQNELGPISFSKKGGVETIIKSYTEEFIYTNNHISQYRNDDYNIIIYKNSDCISELSLKMSNIDFGDCYNKLKEYYNINQDLIITIVENYKIKYKNNPSTTFSLFNPKTGEKLDSISVCKNDTITIKEDLLSLLHENDTNYQQILDLLEQGINIFDPTDDFYTDLCYYYISPVKKDIPLKDRLLEFYPNISLCDSTCKNMGINFTTKEAICECSINDIINNDLTENLLLGDTVEEILDFVNEINIEVLKCLKYSIKYFKKAYGGFIVIALLAISITLTILFYVLHYSQIKIYFFELTKSYIFYSSRILPSNETKDVLESATKNREEEDIKDIKFKNEKDDKEEINKKKKFIRRINNKRNKANADYKNTFRMNEKLNQESQKQFKLIKSTSKDFLEFENKNIINVKKGANNLNMGVFNEEFFNEYLSNSIEDMEFGDALKYDKRTFFETFYSMISNKMKIFYTFVKSEPLKPITIKLVIFVLYINLYFIVNALFFSEDYISKVYHLKKDNFMDFIPRSINRFIYTIAVGAIVEFMIGCLFIEEKKIKRIFKREKNDQSNLKTQIMLLITKMKRRLIAFFIIVYIIYFISFLYIISFNYVYHYTQIEWIKSSIFIIIIMEIIIFLICFISTCLRFLSFRCKSDRLYKLSNLFNEL